MIAAAPPPRSPAVARPAAPHRPAASGAPSLASFLDALNGSAPGKGAGALRAEDGQKDADTGTALPDGTAASPLAWLTAPATPPAVEPAQADTAGATPTPLEAAPVPDLVLLAGADAAGVPGQATSPLAAMLARDPALAAVHGPVTIELPTRRMAGLSPASAPATPPLPSTAMPAIAALATGATAPAGQMFAAALHAAGKDRATTLDPATPDASSAVQHLAADTTAHAVTGAGNTSNDGSLDMSDRAWPQAMMDRIERLRDEANAADTRIRLVPDQLGHIDVAMRREGDTLHVRFHAAEEATRTLLADAQPQLAQIAEQRGMRLGDADVGSGGGSNRGGQDRQPSRPAPVTQRPVAATPVTDLSTDTRIA